MGDWLARSGSGHVFSALKKTLVISKPQQPLISLILLIGLLLVGLGRLALADMRLPAIFSDHMVLQAETPVTVWGWASPAEKVSVSIAGQTQATNANAAGEWRVTLAPMAMKNIATTMTVTGSNALTVADVLVGEVWLGSGQSNMELPVKKANDFAREKAIASLPEIRMFTIKKSASTNQLADVTGSWEICNSNTVGNFSATLYFFGRELHQKLHQPVGLIHSSWGGTPIQAWIPLDALKASPNYETLMERKRLEVAAWPEREQQILANIRAWEAEAAKGTNQNMRMKPGNPGRPDSIQYQPARLYNGMIDPLTDYKIRGVLWYQGEANAREGATGAAFYTDLQTRLIAGWRLAWGEPDLPFLFVQLPNYDDAIDPTKVSWAYFREGQSRTLAIPHTGMAVTVDIGEPGDIHPKSKQEVGRRLALLALSDAYKINVPSRSPEYSQILIKGDEAQLTFNHAEGGLVARGKSIKGFAIAGTDRKWYPATVRIERDHVSVSSPQVAAPVAVRYGWADNPECNLYNRDGLPLAPFRTDAWN